MSNPPKNIKGQKFGELKAVRQVGTMKYKAKHGRVSVSAWLLRCRKRHTETRSLASLRVSRDNAKCRQCKAERRMKK
jgi:hypothetical protein